MTPALPRTVTIDTNVLPIDDLRPLVERRGIELAVSGVTDRELGDGDRRALDLVREPGSFVMGESRVGMDAPASPERGRAVDRILAVVTNGSFPREGQRGQLSAGERRQFRDALIFESRVASRRDAFVTTDRTAFVAFGRREALEREFCTRILTRDEFAALLEDE